MSDANPAPVEAEKAQETKGGQRARQPAARQAKANEFSPGDVRYSREGVAVYRSEMDDKGRVSRTRLDGPGGNIPADVKAALGE